MHGHEPFAAHRHDVLRRRFAQRLDCLERFDSTVTCEQLARAPVLDDRDDEAEVAIRLHQHRNVVVFRVALVGQDLRQRHVLDAQSLSAHRFAFLVPTRSGSS